jgi:hypothetical protein
MMRFRSRRVDSQKKLKKINLKKKKNKIQGWPPAEIPNVKPLNDSLPDSSAPVDGYRVVRGR